uniref:C-type lectin domain-containing protein n=1 Tax=Poecilia mexicana TaxID=48701 RepID=A0A3B3X1Q6_9TELE
MAKNSLRILKDELLCYMKCEHHIIQTGLVENVWFTKYFKAEHIGWRMFRGSCYILSTTTGSWDNARADCRSRGGDLVVINDDDEQKFVLTFSEKSPWIGLKEETEGSWKWVDGTPLSSELKKYWGQGQPDNAGGGEACAQIWENYKTWNDNKCDDSFLWICEKAPEC